MSWVERVARAARGEAGVDKAGRAVNGQKCGSGDGGEKGDDDDDGGEKGEGGDDDEGDEDDNEGDEDDNEGDKNDNEAMMTTMAMRMTMGAMGMTMRAMRMTTRSPDEEFQIKKMQSPCCAPKHVPACWHEDGKIAANPVHTGADGGVSGISGVRGSRHGARDMLAHKGRRDLVLDL
ncbi:hypothetical protein VC83_00440 [Pseudogymnoascus destructans]|uniref:Uncharacterized protein n=1 Tax=Pseudogymnoascus destructans TaxID=655981 RepID=A0A177AMW2_9PEZI|nr:uncharacterized protein VC83_00440 [Pseudogymnoascus destructans]OAF63396.1 hypothetical protein VC83_00440 [Pseudogymnoascus destructans]